MSIAYQHNKTQSQSRAPASSNLLHDILTFKRGQRSKSFNKKNSSSLVLPNNSMRSNFFTAKSDQDNFFNDSIVVPIQKIDNASSNPNNNFTQNRLAVENLNKDEEDSDVCTSYNRVVKYNHQRTDYPMSHVFRHYLDKQHISEPFENPTLQYSDLNYRNTSDNYVKLQNQPHQNYDLQPNDKRFHSNFYKQSEFVSGYSPSYNNGFNDNYGKKNYDKKAQNSYINYDNQSYHREPPHFYRNNTGSGYKNQNFDYNNYNSHLPHQNNHIKSKSKNEKGYKEKTHKTKNENNVTKKNPTVHHKITCCCFSFKWPPWGYEPCLPPTPIFYKRNNFVKEPAALNTSNPIIYPDSSRQKYATEGLQPTYNSPPSQSLYLNSTHVPHNNLG